MKWFADSKPVLLVFAFVFIFGLFTALFSSGKPIIMEPTAESTEEPLIFEPKETYVPVYTEYKSEEAEEYLWYKLSEYSPSDHITAGVLGYFKRESELRSDCISNWHTSMAAGEDVSVIFTKEIDAGLPDGSTQEQFVHDCKYRFGGYGLGQWSRTQYCEDLYELARLRGKSIGDADVQCEFIFLSMEKNEYLWKCLHETDSPTRAGELIALLYDGSKNAMGYTATMATYYYDKYVNGSFQKEVA